MLPSTPACASGRRTLFGKKMGMPPPRPSPRAKCLHTHSSKVKACEIENILETNVLPSGKKEFKVKWEGFVNPTWIKEEMLIPEQLHKFVKVIKPSKKTKVPPSPKPTTTTVPIEDAPAPSRPFHPGLADPGAAAAFPAKRKRKARDQGPYCSPSKR